MPPTRITNALSPSQDRGPYQEIGGKRQENVYGHLVPLSHAQEVIHGILRLIDVLLRVRPRKTQKNGYGSNSSLSGIDPSRTRARLRLNPSVAAGERTMA
jgi:hypothetical protein